MELLSQISGKGRLEALVAERGRRPVLLLLLQEELLQLLNSTSSSLNFLLLLKLKTSGSLFEQLLPPEEPLLLEVGHRPLDGLRHRPPHLTEVGLLGPEGDRPAVGGRQGDPVDGRSVQLVVLRTGAVEAAVGEQEVTQAFAGKGEREVCKLRFLTSRKRTAAYSISGCSLIFLAQSRLISPLPYSRR